VTAASSGKLKLVLYTPVTRVGGFEPCRCMEFKPSGCFGGEPDGFEIEHRSLLR
jgi:hypothetical protein